MVFRGHKPQSSPAVFRRVRVHKPSIALRGLIERTSESEWEWAGFCTRAERCDTEREGAKSRDPAQHRFRRSSARRRVIAEGWRPRTAAEQGWIWHAPKLAGDCPEIGTLSRSILSFSPFFPTNSRSFRPIRAGWMHFENVFVFFPPMP